MNGGSVRAVVRLAWCGLAALLLLTPAARAESTAASLSNWTSRADEALIEFYDDPSTAYPSDLLKPPADVVNGLNRSARVLLNQSLENTAAPLAVGELRGRVQQAIILEMADAVRAGNVADAQAWRAQINLPRGVSANEGELVLLNLPAGEKQREDAARVLVREAITWQTARVRQLLSESEKSASHIDMPLPGRLLERLGEATTLADLPPALRSEAGLVPATITTQPSAVAINFQSLPWSQVGRALPNFNHDLESHLPSLLSDAEKNRRERLLLKLVAIIPKEYVAGVHDGVIAVPLEYREAVSFTAQARQYTDELAPMWLSSKNGAALREPLAKLEDQLTRAEQLISAKKSPDDLAAILDDSQTLLTHSFDISLHRGGTTANIVDEVMLETRSLLSQSLASANAGRWAEAESQRLEAYTTYDPDLEARLMPRDPQLATDIEHLLLDGLNEPGVKALLDERIAGSQLEASYKRVSDALDRATAMLKSGVSPTAAAVNAGSIVLREGLEGLLVIVAILAGLRGDENRHKRRMIWAGVALSMVATVITVVLSQTLITRLHYYGEVIEAITSILAIGILLLITNWLFHQIYWRQWVTALKGQTTNDSIWQLVTVGFLIGYREGFESVLFLQSLTMDVGGLPVSIGVSAGLIILVCLGVAALVLGLKIPYYKLLLGTAMLIGGVLIMFVGTGVRSMQTVGWLHVHKIAATSWPTWIGQWLGIYNSWETLIGQLAAATLVLGTWQFSRWKSRRSRKITRRTAAVSHNSPSASVAA